MQREPLSVRRLILDKQLVLPNTISFPPSQVVDLLIEHDPDHPLAKVINRMFGDEKPKLSEAEKKEKAQLKVGIKYLQRKMYKLQDSRHNVLQ